MPPILSVKDLTFRFFEGGPDVLDHLSLELQEGSVTLITGESGCGKSTLAAVAAGLYPENGGVLAEGSVELCGLPLQGMGPQRRAGFLTMLFQNPDLQFCMSTLRREMRFCMENIRVPEGEMDGRIARTAQETGTGALLDLPLHALSGGEKQRAALACLLAMESRCILLDEPFANIDPEGASELVDLVRRANRDGRTVIVIDHQADRWMGLLDEIVLMEGGRVRWGIAGERAADLFPRPPVPPPRRGNAGELAVEFRGLSIPPLLEDASASFPAGRMTVVLGRSGSGKTTTFLAALGQHPYEGSILIQGMEVRQMKKRELYRRAGIVFQNPSNQFISQNVEEEVRGSLRAWGRDEGAAAGILEEFGLLEKRAVSPYTLSQGQQRRLAVAAMLAGGQQILFLDEPTYGQDRRSVGAIMGRLRRRTEEGLTVIFITHDRDLASAWADKIYCLEDKKLIPKEGMGT